MTDFFKPKPPQPPGNVRIIKTKSTELEFAWDPPAWPKAPAAVPKCLLLSPWCYMVVLPAYSHILLPLCVHLAGAAGQLPP
jgi:hypothetical protein